jgi:Tfp pilus assembly protein PilV
MSMKLGGFTARLIHDERGMTLIEMLIAVVSGAIVMLALFAILDFSINQSGRIGEKVDADQQGRLALEKIALEMQSSCVAAQVTPVQEGSDDTSIQFISVPGSQAYIGEHEAQLHYIHLSGGELIDSIYQSNGGKAPSWTFPPLGSEPLTNEVLIASVSQSQAGSPPAAVPIFKYYRYYTTEDREAVLGEIDPTPLPTPLSENNAKITAEVTVSFSANPTSGISGTDRSAELSDSVLLRFNPTSSASDNAACA